MSQQQSFRISTHVLDTNKGLPVLNLPVKLMKLSGENDWISISEGETQNTGRFVHIFGDDTDFVPSTYKLSFSVKDYYHSHGSKTMYPFIDVIFYVDRAEHYHMPVLLNAFGYTTYRGS